MTEEYAEMLTAHLNRLAKTSIFVLLMLVASKGMTYVYRIIIARSLGVEPYGLLSLSMMVGSLAMTLALLGLDQGLARYIPFLRGKKDHEEIGYIFRKVMGVTIVTGIVSAGLLFAISPWLALNIFHDVDLIIFLRIFSISVPFWVVGSMLLSAVRSYERIKTYSFIFNFVQNVAKIFFLISLIFLGAETLSIPYSFLAGTIILALTSILAFRKEIITLWKEKMPPRAEKMYREMVSYSLPLLFLGAIGGIFYWTDSFMIGYYKDVAAVGLYNVAIPLAALLGLFPEIFMQLFFPTITKEYARGNIRLIKDLTKQVTKWIFIVNIPLFTLILVFPGALINIIFGHEYLGAAPILRILAFGTLVSSILITTNQLVYALGKSKLILTNIIVAACLNLLLSYFLIPSPLLPNNELGIVGAAVATVISTIVLYVLFAVQTYYYTGIVPVRRKMLPALTAAIVAGGLLWAWTEVSDMSNLILMSVAVALFLLVYITFIFLLKVLDTNDKAILMKMWWTAHSFVSKKYFSHKISK